MSLTNIYKGNSKHIFIILSLFVIAIITRIIYVQLNYPVTLDSLSYFLISNDLVGTELLPDNFNKPNLGWPIFLSIIFQISRFENIIEYMNLQKLISIVFSSLSIIPMFFFIRKFFAIKIAMIGTLVFIFSHSIIENSILGTNDSITLFLIITFFCLNFSTNQKNQIISFLIIGIASIFRYESILLFIPAIIKFIIENKSMNDFKKLLILGIFLAIIPIALMMLWRISIGIPEGFISNFLYKPEILYDEKTISLEPKSTSFYFERGVINFIKFSGIILLPFYFILLPYSLIQIIKKNIKFLNLLMFGLFISLSGFYAFARGFEDIKYLFPILPIFIIGTLFLVEKIFEIVKKPKLVLVLFSIAIIFSSLIFIEFNKNDSEYDNEVLEISKKIINLPGKVNDYGKESHIIEGLQYSNYNFPIENAFMNRSYKVVNIKMNTIDEILYESNVNGIKFLIITEKMTIDNELLNQIYHGKNPQFTKIYDSTEVYSKFNLKIFEIIDLEQFNG